MNQESSINHLILEILGGNKSSFDVLYAKYRKMIFLVCLRYAKNRQEAEDFLQDSFIQIFRNLDKYDANKGPFEPWIKKLTVNICLQHLRKTSFKFLLSNLTEIMYLPDNNGFNAIDNLSLQELTSTIQKLPAGYRTVFNLYVLDGFTHKEIAEVLEISENTSKTQLFKARKFLQRMLVGNGMEYSL
jgi:RNA polymerase sigma-70 factor (ECF subfamily)